MRTAGRGSDLDRCPGRSRARLSGGRRELADQYGVLLVFDEIVTGFRLAPGGAQEYYGVTPDLAVFAKGIANGMPLAAVAGRREIMRGRRGALHQLTYGDEALSLAAARAALNVYRQHACAAGCGRWAGR